MAAILDPKAELVNTVRGRGFFFMTLLQTLEAELGADQGQALAEKIVSNFGAGAGAYLAPTGKESLADICATFRSFVPEAEGLFALDMSIDGNSAVIAFSRCAQKDAFFASGADAPTIARCCKMAGCLDTAMFAAAGLRAVNRTWEPGRAGCCHITLYDERSQAS